MRVWTRRDGLTFGLTFLVTLTGYVYSLPHSITMEDAGELAVAGDHLGVPHPPGYPIWTFLAWVFQKVIFWTEYRGYPDPAKAIAFMSAFFGAFACGLTAMLATRFIRHLLCKGLESGTFTRTRHWRYRVIGGLAGIFTCLIWQRFQGAGSFLFTLWALGLIGVGLLQGLTPAEKRYAFQSYLPEMGELGAGTGSFLTGALAWLCAWGWLQIPTLPAVLGLSILGLVAVELLRFGLDYLWGRATQKPNLERDFLGTGVDVILGTATGIMLAFTPLMWSQSVIVEVYSLNAFFLSSLLVLMYTYQQRPEPRILILTAFLFGLGLTNHQSLLFMFFFLVAAVAAGGDKALLKDGLFLAGCGALALLIVKGVQYQGLGDSGAVKYFAQRSVLVLLFLGGLIATRGGWMTRWKTMLLLAGAGALGLSFLLYMPLASSQDPPMDWGNTETWDGFKESVTRGQYARFTVADNVKKIEETMRTPFDPAVLEPGQEAAFAATVARRTLFLHMLGAYFQNPDWKYSIASQFSWAFPTESWDPLGILPPPEENRIHLALLGLIPLLALTRFSAGPRQWMISTLVAMFFVSVIFLTIQWPDLSHNDLWVKRVQYIQAHVLYAFWMGVGSLLVLLALYALVPLRLLPPAGALLLCGTLVSFPLHKEAVDSQHIAFLGSSHLRGYDYGWQYGAHLLLGANGILLDELAHHDDPDALWNPWAEEYARLKGIAPETLSKVEQAASESPRPFSQFRKEILRPLKLSKTEKRTLREATTLAAFRAKSPEEQEAALQYLHRPLPDWNYPPELEPNAVFFGGTDPGRFVPTYMVYSAKVRPDVKVLTQNALAQSSYMSTVAEQYGEELILPSTEDQSRAFLSYANELRMFDTRRFRQFRTGPGTLAVSGFYEVMKINEYLSQQIVEENQDRFPFYLEESTPLKWMIHRQRPHGLLFKIGPEDVTLTREEITQNREFWDWMEEWLLETYRPIDERKHLYHRELQVRKSYSKLRLAQAQNFYARGLFEEAEYAVRQALRLYPAGPEIVQVASDMLMRLRKFEDAAMILAAYSRHDPTNRFLPRFTQLLQLLRQKDQQRLELEEKFSYRITGKTTLQLLYLYSDLSMEDRMKDMADLLLTLPRLSPDFYREMAAFMRDMQNEEYYEKALMTWAEKAPEDPRPQVELAVISLSRSDIPAMYQHLLQAIRVDGDQARREIHNDIRFLEVREDPRFLNLVAIRGDG